MMHFRKVFLTIVITITLFLNSCDNRLNSVKETIHKLAIPEKNTVIYSSDDDDFGWQISIYYDSYDYLRSFKLSEGPCDLKADWSSDKQWIYFIRSDSQQISRIWKMHYNGHEKHPITSEIINCQNLDVSHSGHHIVFNANIDDENHLIVCDASGFGWRQITRRNLIPSTGPVKYLNPSWLPDEQSIIFEYYLANEDKRGLAIIQLNGSISRCYTEIDHLHPSYPRWSPTRDEFVFVSTSDSGTYIYRMNADGTDLIKLTEESISRDPDWSYDGNCILYVYEGTYISGSGKEEFLCRILSITRDGTQNDFILGMIRTNIYQPVW